MNKNVLFSIIIPTYNRADLLKRCLDSIEAQTYQSWEAIVVDNYSEDNTEDVVKSYNDDRIIYIKNHNHGIIAVSRNKALDVAKGDWVAFLDSDDCWLPNKLEYVLPYLDGYDLVYHGYQQNIEKERVLHQRKRLFYEIKEPTVAYVLQRGDPISPSCTCVSRKTIGETRFWEDPAINGTEDYDFFLQLIAKGIKIKYIKVVLTLYDVNGCSHSEKALSRAEVLLNKWDSYLTKDEKEEVRLFYVARKAGFLLLQKKYEEAYPLYREVFRKSKVWQKRETALKCMIKCKLKFIRL